MPVSPALQRGGRPRNLIAESRRDGGMQNKIVQAVRSVGTGTVPTGLENKPWPCYPILKHGAGNYRAYGAAPLNLRSRASASHICAAAQRSTDKLCVSA